MTQADITKYLERAQQLLAQAEQLFGTSDYDESERCTREALALLESHVDREDIGSETNSTSGKYAILSQIAAAYNRLNTIANRRGDLGLAREYADTSLHFAERIGDKKRIAAMIGNIGILYIKSSDNDNALLYLHRAISLADELGLQDIVARNRSNIGTVYFRLGDHAQALAHFQSALQTSEVVGDKNHAAIVLGNIGLVHMSQSDYPQALRYFNKGLSLHEELGHRAGASIHLGNIGTVYFHLSDYAHSLEYTTKALAIDEEIGNKSGIATQLGSIGNIYNMLSDYPRALEYFEQALRIAQEVGDYEGEARHLACIGLVHSHLSDHERALSYYERALRIDEEHGHNIQVPTHISNMGTTYLDMHDYARALECFTKANGILEALNDKIITSRNLSNIGTVYSKLGDYQLSLQYHLQALAIQESLSVKSDIADTKYHVGLLYADPKNEQHDDVKAEQYLLASVSLNDELGMKNYEVHGTLAEIYKRQERWREYSHHIETSYRIEREVQSDEAKKAAALVEQKKQIAEREKEIDIARATSSAKLMATTSLLHKVLPATIATRMIEGEQDIADYFPSVSILFADIAGFTPMSTSMTASNVVRFLNFVFAEFDRIIKKHGCEKIKTIGDGYLAVAGAPIECDDHAERLAAAALEMQERIVLPDSIREYMPDGTKLGVRIGLHTGSIVAGVIGEERFVYDIYSDAVNTAARMESHGEENRIHISNDFFRHLQNRFAMTKNTTHGFVFEKRGEMEIKGKGMMRTYFLERA